MSDDSHPNLSRPELALVIANVWRSRPIFKQEQAALAALEQLDKCAQHLGISLVAYALLPSRLHLILNLPHEELLFDFIPLFLSRCSREIKKLNLGPLGGAFHDGGKFQLWKRHVEEIAIISESDFHQKLDFVHRRPVKAGLTDTAEKWPYSSASAWSGTGSGPIGINKNIHWP